MLRRAGGAGASRYISAGMILNMHRIGNVGLLQCVGRVVGPGLPTPRALRRTETSEIISVAKPHVSITVGNPPSAGSEL
jgi:hypothetical protein